MITCEYRWPRGAETRRHVSAHHYRRKCGRACVIARPTILQGLFKSSGFGRQIQLLRGQLRDGWPGPVRPAHRPTAGTSTLRPSAALRRAASSTIAVATASHGSTGTGPSLRTAPANCW
jgi:hypothetical protein